MGEATARAMSVPFDLLLGRRTYDIFAAHWPYAIDEPGAEPLNRARKYVASTTVDRVEWQNSTLLGADVPGEVARLKRQDGPEIQVHGSSHLLQTLQRQDLVDEYRLWIFPVVVGSGKRLFAEGTLPSTFTASGMDMSTTGVMLATYERVGEVGVGSFALDEPTDLEVEQRRRLGD